MRSAFLGYVIVWGQISYWGATVITGLVTVLPYRFDMLEFVWGRAFCGIRTVNRFLSLHIVLPMVVIRVIVLHLMMLHGVISRVGGRNSSQVLFTSLLVKDGLNLILMIVLFILMIFIPNYFIDAEN
jgi:ubiquinol-cytochrome c reductase cytochrome b/c1 subunit